MKKTILLLLFISLPSFAGSMMGSFANREHCESFKTNIADAKWPSVNKKCVIVQGKWWLELP
ncbi:hypothetical protein AAGR22_05405 [Erwinia sp. HDF1-3R]|uniref:hypothetical protein n=1 Tax=Erwinia sp. HDF1-3R TaxID=3141543 RepID=UPI0031F5851C